MEKSMQSTAVWESEGLELVSSAHPVEDTREARANNIGTIKELAFRLLREVQSISEVRILSLEKGLDFYDEVSRFEIDLIKRALRQTGGHQGRAARLLNLKVTTLNSKIKHYNINLNAFANGYPLVESSESKPASSVSR
jgi:transcriptional regulator with GAF, ATPase, and Fis domain